MVDCDSVTRNVLAGGERDPEEVVGNAIALTGVGGYSDGGSTPRNADAGMGTARSANSARSAGPDAPHRCPSPRP